MRLRKSVQSNVLEHVNENATVRWAKRRGIEVTKLNLQGNRGWPDRCFWIPGGKPALIEFKRVGKKPEKLQQHRINTLKGLRYYVASFESSEKAIDWLEWVIEQNRRREERERSVVAQAPPQKRRRVAS